VSRLARAPRHFNPPTSVIAFPFVHFAAMSFQSLPHTRMAVSIALHALGRTCPQARSSASAAVTPLRCPRLPPQFSAFLHYSAVARKPSLEPNRMPDHAIVEPGPSRTPEPASPAKKTREFKAKQAAITMVRPPPHLEPFQSS
jgi:hypothetical protein